MHRKKKQKISKIMCVEKPNKKKMSQQSKQW